MDMAKIFQHPTTAMVVTIFLILLSTLFIITSLLPIILGLIFMHILLIFLLIAIVFLISEDFIVLELLKLQMFAFSNIEITFNQTFSFNLFISFITGIYIFLYNQIEPLFNNISYQLVDVKQ